MGRFAFLLISAAFVVPAPAAFADIPVIDDDVQDKRTDDEKHSGKDTQTRADELEQQTVTNCNISSQEKGRRLRRSPAQAVEEDAANVALIRYYAEKYDVPVGLALSVAHAESGISTCSGSPTGVKGVMQLTKKTGAGMGFDRDINEENIEGGVKYLGMGVSKCGATNFTCLAAWYNGSTATEQAGWANNVARNYNWFTAYAGGSNIAEISSPSFKTYVDYGSSATRSANSSAVSAITNAGIGIDRSTAEVQAATSRIDMLASLVGSSEIYQEAWDGNTQARGINAELVNDLIAVRNLFNELLTARMQIEASKTSETSKVVTSDPTVNPYSCDPAILEKMAIPQARWPACAITAAATTGDSITITDTIASSQSVAANLAAVQQAANADEQGSTQ